MSSHISSLADISHIFFINLDHRTDRKDHVQQQLANIGLLEKAQRFPAIKMKWGAIGCTMSHLKILETAAANHWNHVMIIEDDITFLEPDLFVQQFNTFLLNYSTNLPDWDVVLISGNNIPPYEKIDDTCIRVSACQTTTGYLVAGHYIATLAQNIREGLARLLRNPENKLQYAIDRYWFPLQKRDRWFLIIPLTVVQMEGYSDIECRTTNYAKLMTDLDKPWLIERQKIKKQQREAMI